MQNRRQNIWKVFILHSAANCFYWFLDFAAVGMKAEGDLLVEHFKFPRLVWPRSDGSVTMSKIMALLGT
jgi:hypothetical protein